ncbi:tRNA1(Val) (adenine(37)-N6)-methyltransferase [Hansschlegelia sp. KR7-227]|uniref:tRNA1(Val) (adenine(37)-N6)-methyltransferase n=1 Tax=Hansschlegelia sp. KR7-227 TaxID=3400914 RepID=UPI003BFE20D5
MTSEAGDLTDDLFLGGRLRLLQPRRGHRAGGDAALLAAAGRSRLDDGATAVDLGAGTGAVGLAIAAFGAARVTLVEIDPALAALAEENARRNGLADRVAVFAEDVVRLAAPAECADLVVANPPFDAAGRFRVSPDAGKALAHSAPEELLEDWARAAARLLRPGGSLVLIHRPEALNALLRATERRFGAVRLRAIHPRADAPAARILLAARKGGRGSLALLPPLVMHDAGGGFTPEVEAAQRGEATLDMG